MYKMKPIKFLLLTALFLVFLAIFSGANLRSNLDKLFNGSRLEILDTLQHSDFLPAPLRGALEPSDGKLTVIGTFEATNSQRKIYNLKQLKRNNILDKAAMLKLQDMFAKQYFEHVSPSGTGPADLAKEVEYSYVIVGENLALGNFQNDEALVEAWMNSPGHRENILNSRYQDIGLAVGQGIYEGKNVWLAVQSFGTPLSACPGVNKGLSELLQGNQDKVTALQASLVTKKQEIDQIKQSGDSELYNQKVREYNALVGQVNSLINETKELVNKYNQQVNQFNECVKK